MKKINLKRKMTLIFVTLLLLLVIIPILGMNRVNAATSITINATNFPDDEFRLYVKNKIANKGTTLTSAMITSTTSMDLSKYEIYDLKGINYFTSLTSLRLIPANSSDIEISKEFDCENYFNQSMNEYDYDDYDDYDDEECGVWLESLNISKLTKLKYLYIGDALETETLDLSYNKELLYLDVSEAMIDTLKISNCTKLQRLNCSNMEGCSIVGLENLVNLTTLCVSEMDGYFDAIPYLTSLKYLTADGYGCMDCDEDDCDEYDEDEIYENDDIKIDFPCLSNNSQLIYLDCSNSSLNSLDVSKNPHLQYLNCRNNFLTNLDISNNAELKKILCDGNYLTHLDISNNSNLSYVDMKEGDFHEHVIGIDGINKDYNCEVGGRYSYTCEECGVKVVEYKEPTVHNWEVIGSRESTCSNKGWKYKQCKNCSADELEEILEKEHRFVETENGLVCKDCGCKRENGDEESGPHVHDMHYDIITAPTCQEFGEVAYLCSKKNCNYVEKKYQINKVEHEGIVIPKIQPTCTTPGLEDKTICKWCGKTLEEGSIIPATGHTIEKDLAVKPTCTEYGKTEGTHCKVCGEILQEQEKVDMIPHEFEDSIVKATLTSDGYYKHICKYCGYFTQTDSFSKIAGIKLSSTSYAYNGKEKKPTATVTDGNGVVIAPSNYTIAYKANKNVGGATATIKLSSEKYSGSKALSFTIKPMATSISSITAKSKALNLKWAKKTSQVTGYQIQYSASSKFATKKTISITKATTYSKSITGLSAKKLYYVRVRTYKTVSGKKYYSAWSTVKSKKTL